MALPKDKELILEKHCPSMSLLYLDDMGRAFRKRILAAMEEYANAKNIEEIDSDHLVIIGRLKEELRDKTDQAQKLVEALKNIKKWCEESGLKEVAIDDPKGMAIYHSLHLSKNALQQWNAGKEVSDE